jgi:hypothetical protein
MLGKFAKHSNRKNRLLFAVLLLVSLGTLAFGQVADSAAPAAAAGSASATVPRLIQFSGAARDGGGKPLTGTIGITFFLYKEEQGGAPLWIETQNVQADSKGHYAVQLGATKPDGLPTDVFVSGEARWLGVQISGEAEQPRVLLLSVPYALKAADAETLGGKPLSAFQLTTPESGISSATTLAEQANEIRCSGSANCKTGFIPEFSSNGGSATVTDSIMTQSGTSVGIAGSLTMTGNLNASSGQVLGQTGFFSGSNSGAIFQATQNNSTNGAAIAGVSSGNSGVGVQGSGVTGVFGTGLSPANSIGVAGTGNLYGVEGTTSSTSGSSAGVFGNATATSGSAAGVWGESRSGNGVFGGSTATSGTTYGVIGINNNPAGVSAGVEGQSFATSGTTWGVVGASKSPKGIGAIALGVSESNTGFGLIGCCPVGVWGDTGSNAPGAAGLVGTADDARAIYLQNNSPSGVPTAFMFQGASGKLALVAGGGTGACTVDTNGNLFCHGSKSAVVSADNGQRQVALYAVEAPQNWFEDFGSGRLTGGAASVALEPIFAQTVNTGSEYHVFLTPEGDGRGLYVSNKSATGFEVHELGGGQSNVAFDYRIVALRRGYENVRLEDKTAMMVKVNESVPKPLATPRTPVLPSMGPEPTVTVPPLPLNRAAVTPAKLAVAGNTN